MPTERRRDVEGRGSYLVAGRRIGGIVSNAIFSSNQVRATLTTSVSRMMVDKMEKQHGFSIRPLPDLQMLIRPHGFSSLERKWRPTGKVCKKKFQLFQNLLSRLGDIFRRHEALPRRGRQVRLSPITGGTFARNRSISLSQQTEFWWWHSNGLGRLLPRCS